MIPLSVPNISGNEWKYVKDCLDTQWVSSVGKYVDIFEQKIAEYTGARYAIACVNGTSALQVSLRLAGVKPGDEVIIPALTFISPVNAIAYNGANPVFIDVDKFYNLDINKTIEFIQTCTEFKDGFTYNKKTDKRISAIVPVHIWGNAVWMDELISLCGDRNIAVVEDASESLGTFYSKGKYSGRHTGTIGKLGCLSFNGNKIITTGGGGMILTDDQKLAEKSRYLTSQAKDDPVYYVHHEIGYNFRLTNIQAALGVAQLEKLQLFLARKREIFKKYKTAIYEVDGLIVADVPMYAKNNNWMILLQIDKNSYGKGRKEIMDFLGSNNIQTRPAWAPIHLQRPYQHCQKYQIKRAEELVDISLCLPSSTHLSNDEIDKVIGHLNG